MNDPQNTLKRRFPLLTSLRIFHGPGNGEDLATFMGVLLAAMEGSRDSSFCFVFPRKSGIAPLSATLYALGRFAVDFPELAERFAKSGFQIGQRVKLVPEDKVFVFGGVWPGLEKWFQLRLLDDKRKTKFNWPISEILRIEPTTHRIPKGREDDVNVARRKAPLSTLDRLIGTRTFGNDSLAVNYVLYLGGRTEIEDFFAATSLTGPTAEVHSTLDQLIKPGVITESGEIRHQDNYQAAGQPLVATTSRIEHVVAACRLANPRSKVVVVDGAKRITDLASFDFIAESQNLIIVSSPDEEEKLQQLHDRGCKFWRFSLADLEIGGSVQHRGRFFSGVFRSAHNEASFRTDVVPCNNFLLEKVASALETCQGALSESERDETQLILGNVYSLMLYCAGLLSPPDPDEQASLLERAERLSASACDRFLWLPEVAAKALQDACTGIILAIQDPELGVAKGNALKVLLSALNQQGVNPIAVVARSVSSRMGVIQWLTNEGFNIPVVLPAKVDENGFTERLICASWPGSESFGKLVRKFSTAQVSLVAYPFEVRWLHLYGRKRSNNHLVPNMTATEKSSLLGLSGGAVWPADSEPEALEEEPSQASGDFLVDLEAGLMRKGLVPVGATGEETIPATMISFLGDAYAFLTDAFRIPVITDLVSGAARENYKVPRRQLAEIQASDVLVFRESGKRDVIQALADAQIGPEAPVIRERAARWHKALRGLGLNEETLMAELREFNCPRTLQTVRGWLAGDFMIGPQTRADLEAIAYVVGDQKFLDEVPSMWAAIHFLRGEHLSAGMRLSRILLERLPERLEEIQDGRTRIEIDSSLSVWVVQVESIAGKAEPLPRSYVNTLLWDTEDLFEGHLWPR